MAAVLRVLVAESEALDDLLVFFLRAVLDEVEQLAAARDHRQKAAAGREVLLVRVEVLGEVMNALGEECDLIRCAAGVAFVELIILRIDLLCAHSRRGWNQRWPDRPCLVGGRIKGGCGRECKTIAWVTGGIFWKFREISRGVAGGALGFSAGGTGAKVL